MKKRRVMAMLLASTIAVSQLSVFQPLPAIAAENIEVDNEDETEISSDDAELLEEPAIEESPDSAQTVDMNNEQTEDLSSDSSSSSLDSEDLTLEDFDTTNSESVNNTNPSCLTVFSNGTFTDIEVSDKNIALDDYKLDVRELTGDKKAEEAKGVEGRTPVIMFALEVKDTNDNELLLTDDNEIKMTMDDMTFLKDTMLHHKKEDGTWENLEYKYSHNDVTNKYEITFPGKTFGIFSFTKEEQLDLTVNDQKEPEKEPEKEPVEDFADSNTSENLTVIKNIRSFSWNGGIAGNNDVNITVDSEKEFPETDILQVAEIPEAETTEKTKAISKMTEKETSPILPVELKICNANNIEESMDETYDILMAGFEAPEGSVLYHELLNGNYEVISYEKYESGVKFRSKNGLGTFLFVTEKEKQKEPERVTEETTEPDVVIEDTEKTEEKTEDVNEETNAEEMSTYTFEDDDVTITATVKDEAEIPETAELKAEKLEEGSDAYNTALSEVENSVKPGEGQKLLFMPYDVYFINNGEKIEPADGAVQVKMAFKNELFGKSPELNETFAAHIKNDGVVEKITNETTEKNTVEFSVKSFSIMGPAMITAANDDDAAKTVEPIIIDEFNARFLSGAKLIDGKYVWNPTDSAENHMFVYHLDYTMSGVFSTDRGAFKIEVPLHILKDRDGNWADTFDCPYPLETELTEEDTPDFAYRIDEENNKAIIYNYNPYPTGEAGYIEISYSTTRPTIYYTDMGGSTELNAKVYATNSNSTVTKDATATPVYIDTHATISYVEKRVPTLYRSWDSNWGEKPADADDYLYLVWPIRTYINKNTSPYNFSLEDIFTSLGGSVVGYKFSGQSKFSEANHVENVMGYGDRYDFVLTRHNKSMAEDEMNATTALKYKVHNDVTATVDPIDQVDEDTTAVSARDWWYEAPRYTVPTGHFWAEKWGMYGRQSSSRSYGTYPSGNIVRSSEDISDYTLAEFCAGDEDAINGLYYYTYANAYPYPWTLADGATGTIEDVRQNRYGQKKVDFNFTDDIFYVENEKLDDTDYDLTKAYWKPTISDAGFNEESLSFYEKSITNFKDEDNITIWARKGSDWKQAAVYNLQNRAYENVDADCIKSAAGTEIDFAAGVKGIRFTCSNAYYHTLIGLYPEISLKRTDHVLNLAGTKNKIRVTNESNFTVTQNGGILFARTVQGTDYIQRVIRESEIKKDIIQTKNSKKDLRFDVTWRVIACEKYVDNEGMHYIRQESGKFYDLLPAGAILSTQSISVTASGEELGIGQYNYEVVNNFRNSGRQMLVITINENTTQTYSLKYMTSHTYESINDYGKNLLNSVAYESGNDKIGEGLPDNGGTITDKEYMKDLDKTTDAEKFKYAEARYNINILMAAATGLKKQIKNSTAKQYSYNTTVHLNEDYSYQVRLANDTMTASKDIVFFDSLENFFQKSDETAPTKVSDWKGTLTGIDVNNLIFKGIAPDIYLSNMDTMNIHNHHDLYEKSADGESVWIPYDEFAEKYGLDKATAIAVDASTTVSGNDYVMALKESISFNIYMKAPAEDKSGKIDPIAYNNIYVSRTALKESEGETYEIPQFYHQDYTQAHYRVAGSFNLKKVDETDMTTPIKGTTYRLSGTSDYGTEYLEERVSDKNGNMSFETIEKGTYELRETDCSVDWQLNMETYTVKITNNGTAEIEGLAKDGETFIVSDKPRIHADAMMMKYNNVTGGTVKGAKFRLSGTSDYGNDYMLYAESNDLGIVYFENLELGIYELTETEAPEGYIKKKEPWTIKVDERGVAAVYENDKEAEKNKNGYYIIINEPYHSIRFVKSSTYGDNVFLEGAEFSLTGISDYGTSVEATAVSGKAEDGGLVVFKGLEPGTYILKETKAPAEHDLNEKPYTVVVNYDGSFTIDGLEKIKFGTSKDTPAAASLLEDADVTTESKQSLLKDVEKTLPESETLKDAAKDSTTSILDAIEKDTED